MYTYTISALIINIMSIIMIPAKLYQ